jgi:hypothetical protein
MRSGRTARNRCTSSSGNCYKGYPTQQEAVAKWRKHQSNKSKMKTFIVLSLLLTIVGAVLYFILV